jgi:hypothetical protein
MSSTVFTGPLLAGNVLNSDGTGNLSGAGGSSGTQNVGFVSMFQFSAVNGVVNSAIPQSTTAFATSIVIPAQSIITDIYVFVTTVLNSSATISIGTSTACNELATGISGAVGQQTVSVTSLVPAWLNSSSTQDIQIYCKASAQSGTAGGYIVAVSYCQGVNGFTNGQYT